MQVPRVGGAGDHLFYFSAVLNNTVNEQTTFELSKKNLEAMHPNGPAVCFSRRNPTTAPGRVLVPRASGATKLSRCKEGLARVFAVMVQILLSSGAVAVLF